jgi:hypothetical protein
LSGSRNKKNSASVDAAIEANNVTIEGNTSKIKSNS